MDLFFLYKIMQKIKLQVDFSPSFLQPSIYSSMIGRNEQHESPTAQVNCYKTCCFLKAP
jgi:hypothetical protein